MIGGYLQEIREILGDKITTILLPAPLVGYAFLLRYETEYFLGLSNIHVLFHSSIYGILFCLFYFLLALSIVFLENRIIGNETADKEHNTFKNDLTTWFYIFVLMDLAIIMFNYLI